MLSSPHPLQRGTKFNKFYILIILIIATGVTDLFAQPTANIAGPTNICANDSAELTVTFTDVAPWNIKFVKFSAFEDTTISYTNITDNPFSIYVHYEGNYYLDEVTNINGTGAVSGAVTLNEYFPPTSSSINGNTTKCPYDSVDIPVALTGNSPWKITYTINGIGSYIVDNMLTSPYNLQVFDSGTYQIIEVEDKNCKGSNNGSYKVNNYTLPDITAYGSDTVCKDALSSIFVSLSGNAPWSLKHVKNNADTTSINNLNSAISSFNVKGEGTYEIIEVSDNNCSKSVSETIEKPAYPNDNVFITGLNSAYSVNADSVHMSGHPHGGQFIGKGVVGSDSLFYPAIASVDESPHDIIYRYTNPLTGCITDDTISVNVITANAFIVFPDNKKNFCFYDDSVEIEGVNLNDIIGSFSIPENSSGIKNKGNNLALIYPSILNNGSFTVKYTYTDGDVLTVEETITVDYINAPVMNNLSGSLICKNTGKIPLSGNNANGTFTGKAIDYDPTENEYYFNPEKSSLPTDTIIYLVESANGCSLDTVQIITIKDIPKVNFSPDISCVSETKLKPVHFNNATTSTDSVVQWTWSFGDETSSSNTSALKNPSHTYAKSGPRNVQLIASTIEGCSDTLLKIIDFKNAPTAQMKFSTVCLDTENPINITNQSIGNSIKQTLWNVYDEQNNTIVENDSSEHLTYAFDSLGKYFVRLAIEDSFNCVDTFIVPLTLKPIITLTEDTFYYRDFEQINDWETLSSDTLNSWKFGASTLQGINALENGKMWYTDITTRSVTEQSWIESPCFNFSELSGASISIDIFELFEKNRDGAVLQYALNTPEEWKNTGSVNQGINWFNSFQINGEPGNQPIGWSAQNTKWKKSESLLDYLAGEEYAIFRIAYGSDGTTLSNQGIAIDNITIRPRFNKSISEIFINPDSATNKNLTDLFNANDINPNIIPIQYHTNYPKENPLYQFNPSIVSARQLFYNINNAPYMVLNGTKNFDLNETFPEVTALNNSLLTQSPFKLTLTDTLIGNELTSTINVKATETVLLNNLTLFTIIAENNLKTNDETYFNVARYILPNNGGKSLSGTLLKNDTIGFTFKKALSTEINWKNISVIAFIQNANSKEILQATIDSSELSLVINSERNYAYTQDFYIYPNPAENLILLSLPTTSTPRLIRIYNAHGQLMLEERSAKNTVDISWLNNGIYVAIIAYNSRIYRTKFVKQ